MSEGGFKGVMKGGWHPKAKDGKSGESWRGDFKGINQVAGWMGKGKDPRKDAEEHVARPLSSLKDPSSFAPPPKHINYHGGAAMPDRITPDKGGWGAPLSQEELQKQEQERREAEEAANKPKPPPVPYRMNTTGLSTSHLPPPPARRDGADGRLPALEPPPTTASAPGAKPKPSLPPRLPPRQNSNPTLNAPLPPPTYGEATTEPPAHRGILNQTSLNRLGAAGVSVPGFGIGKPAPPPPASRPVMPPPTASASSSANAQLGELQSRFSRLGTSSPKPEAPSQGTSFAEKQAALKTASAFRNNPSSVSLSDARAAASTANNFRERHGDQIAAGWQSANKLNSKYGIADKAGHFAGTSDGAASPAEPARETPNPFEEARKNGSAFKKKAPPPPRKKAELSANSAAGDGPPPIPLASKPKPPVSNY